MDMKRSEFLRTLIAGVAVTAIPGSLILDHDYDVLKAAKLQVESMAGAPKNFVCSFKISQELWDKCANDDGTLSIKHLDDLCIEMSGYPIKEVGYEEDDFLKNQLTVVSFRKEIENEKLTKMVEESRLRRA